MKNIVIIGAGSGIGLKSAEFLSKDHHVYCLTRSFTAELSQLNTQNFQFDSNLDDLSTLDLPEQIDGLVFCPGSILLKPFHRITKDEFLEHFQQNTLGAVDVIQKLLPKLKKSEQASIVLFSSVAASTGMTFHSLVSTIKAGIEGLTKALAAEYAPKIRVNCIAPSLTKTNLSSNLTASEEKIESAAQRHPLKKIGNTEDIAYLVDYLISNKSSWVSGQIFHVDGGMSTLK